MIITRTPLRVSFFGGGTDYPVWYREHGGSVLARTILKGYTPVEGWPTEHLPSRRPAHRERA